MNETTTPRVIVGYDGSLPANAAIAAGALLLPRAHSWITHLWTPPFASEPLRHRLWHGNAELDEFVAAIELEGAWEADQLAATGVALAVAAGWVAEPVVRRAYGGEGMLLTELTGEIAPDLVLLGSRGLGGARAVLGSVSDMVVHYSPRPVVVVPYPLLMAEHACLAGGPVIVGWDGSAGSQAAYAAAARLFTGRELILAGVGEDAPPPAVADGVEVPVLHVGKGHGDAARAVAGALAECARERDAALLVVGSRGRSAVQEILLGSVAMATLHNAHRPTMVVPHPQSR